MSQQTINRVWPGIQRIVFSEEQGLRALLGKVAHVFANNWGKQALALALGVYVARAYGASGKGVYYLVVAATSMLGVLLSFGVNNAVVFYVKQGQLHPVRGLVWVIRNSLLVASVCAPMLWMIREGLWSLFFRGVDYSVLYLVFIVVHLPITMVSLFFATYLMASHDTTRHRLLTVGAPLSTLVLTIVLHQALGVGIVGALSALLASQAVFAIGLTIWLRKATGAPLGGDISMRSVYSYGMRGHIGSVGGTVLAQVDSLLIAGFTTPAMVGLYSVAKSLYRLLLSVPYAINGVAFGQYCDLPRAEAIKLNRSLTRRVAAGLIVIAIPCLLLGRQYVGFLYGGEFIAAVPALNILIIAAIIVGASSTYNVLFLACGRPGVSSTISVISSLLIVVATAVLVPRYSIEGAAVGSLIGSVSFTLLRIIYGKRLEREYSHA